MTLRAQLLNTTAEVSVESAILVIPGANSSSDDVTWRQPIVFAVTPSLDATVTWWPYLVLLIVATSDDQYAAAVLAGAPVAGVRVLHPAPTVTSVALAGRALDALFQQ